MAVTGCRLASRREEAYRGTMKLHGSTEGNLIAAVRSANRLRSHPVHVDTIEHWASLLRHARQELATCIGVAAGPLARLVSELEVELARRPK